MLLGDQNFYYVEGSEKKKDKLISMNRWDPKSNYIKQCTKERDGVWKAVQCHTFSGHYGRWRRLLHMK
jgi:hypothetical protein